MRFSMLYRSLGAFCVCLPLHLSSVAARQYTSACRQAVVLYERALSSTGQDSPSQQTIYLKRALRHDPGFIEAVLQLASLAQKSGRFTEAIQILDKGLAHINQPLSVDLCCDVAACYYACGAYSASRGILDRVSEHHADFSATQRMRFEQLLNNLEFAAEYTRNPVCFQPKLLPYPLNQFASQYFPVLTADQKTLYFTARRRGKQASEGIYVSHQDAQGGWSPPLPFRGVRHPERNEGTCTVSADGKTSVFTVCACAENRGVCDLYITRFVEGAWSTPQNMGPQVNSSAWDSQPSLSPDGRTLYFVSERQGNYGQKDIWQTTMQPDGRWSRPTNLGPRINSSGREVSPFMHPNGQTLFFASDRLPSLGGLSIYYSQWLEGQWSEPICLPYPINRHTDQAAFFLTADGKTAYYADGKQQNTRCYDSHLYTFDFPPALLSFPAARWVQLHITDTHTQQPTSALVEVYDLDTHQLHFRTLSDPSQAHCGIVVNDGKRYGVFIRKDDRIFESMHIDCTSPSTVVSPSVNIRLERVQKGAVRTLTNVFFDFDCWRIKPESTTELDQLVSFLTEHPQICIEVAGHTDSVGDPSYNQTLSQKRADSVKDHLIRAGIEKHRIQAQGYGLHCPATLDNTPEGHSLNRRVAFKVVCDTPTLSE